MKVLDLWAGIFFSPVLSFQKLARENYGAGALASLITVGAVFGFFLSTCLAHGFFPSVIVTGILLFAFLSVFTSAFYFLFSRLFGSDAGFWKLCQVCSLSYLPLLPALALLAPFSWRYMFDITWYGGGAAYPLFCIGTGVVWCWILSILGLREVTGMGTMKSFIVTLLSGIALMLISFAGLVIALMPYFNILKVI